MLILVGEERSEGVKSRIQRKYSDVGFGVWGESLYSF